MADDRVSQLQAFIRPRDPQGSAVLEGTDYVVRFSTLGAPQELRIQEAAPDSLTLTYSARSPDATERWFLESKAVWFPEHAGCRKVKLAPLDERYKLFASDEPFFRTIFEAKDLSDALLRLPADDHVKASLKDTTMTVAWTARAADLLQCAEVMVTLGGQCFKHVQVARMMKR
jgi:hypothetical protein